MRRREKFPAWVRKFRWAEEEEEEERRWSGAGTAGGPSPPGGFDRTPR